MSVLVNVGTSPSVALAIIQKLADQVIMRLIPQLINGIPKVLQKLLRCFNGTIMSKSFFWSFPISPIIF